VGCGAECEGREVGGLDWREVTGYRLGTCPAQQLLTRYVEEAAPGERTPGRGRDEGTWERHRGDSSRHPSDGAVRRQASV
jgi:hypothetical protein